MSFHLKTVLLVESGWNFPTSCIETIKVSAVVSGGTQIPFDIAMDVDSEFPFDGTTNTITLSLSAVWRLKRVQPGLVTILLSAAFDFGGAASRVRHEQRGTLRRCY